MKKLFKTNQGELSLEISGNTATGTYQKDGVISGEFIENTFTGQWENKGLQGLMEFTIQDKKLLGSWKKGTEPGPMRGTWKGELIEVEGSNVEVTAKKEPVKDEEWTIIHDIAVYYVLFGMESASYVKTGQTKDSLWCAPEWNYITEIMPKWAFKFNGKVYGVENGSENLETVLERILVYLVNKQTNE